MSGGVAKLAAIGVGSVGTAVVLALATLGGSLGAAVSGGAVSLASILATASGGCVADGPVPTLSRTQALMAADVVAAVFAVSAENTTVARIALMTAYTESSLRDLGPLPGNDGSLGLFQQRTVAGWGTAAEELDPRQATGMFVSALLRLPGWTSLAPWVAAQEVQHSAFTGIPSPANGGSSVVGANYRDHWGIAGTILAAVLSNGSRSSGCGQGIPGGEVGPASAHGLPLGYRLPPGTGPGHAAAVRFALSQLGKPYVWGAAGPAAYDCSGLTLAAWATAGISLDHYTVDQQHEGIPVAAGAMQAGDLVLTPGSDSPGPGLAGHVGIYLGYGLVESAVDPQFGVIVQSWQRFVSGGIDGLVDPDPADG